VSKLKFLRTLQTVIEERLEQSPATSYTARLAAKGKLKVAQKVGEEGVELALAAIAEDNTRVTEEAADLIYHMLVLLAVRGIPFSAVTEVLENRHSKATGTARSSTSK
jgi:phosphoribosyl-ATP pyrophosphohydrolase/phosphoribosyl-AMP cyclohydrolase